MGNCFNRLHISKYNKLTVESIKDQTLVEVKLKYKNGIKQKLKYPASEEWINAINDSIRTGYINGDSFPKFEWIYSK